MKILAAITMFALIGQVAPINDVPPPKDPTKCEKCALKMTSSGMQQVCVPCDQPFPK
jgi:hypothetical protein